MNSKDLLKRIDTGKLYGPFVVKLELLLDACLAKGAQYYATSGLRTFAEQDSLYAVGRTVGRLGHFVTKAKGGQSNHNYGCAVDMCRDTDVNKIGLQPSYKDLDYLILAEEAKKLGLDSGYFWTSFKDNPHIQLPFKKHGITLSMLSKEYSKGGYLSVFKFLDKYKW